MLFQGIINKRYLNNVQGGTKSIAHFYFYDNEKFFICNKKITFELLTILAVYMKY